MKSLVVVFTIMIGTLSVQARPPHAKPTVEACLARSKTPNSDACIGVTSNSCIGPNEASKSSRDIIACLNDEQQQWDRVLNASFQALKNGLEPDQQKKLTEMQRAWLNSRALTCGFYEDYFEGSMAYPMIANCLNRETARRAIFLKGFADDMAQRK